MGEVVDNSVDQFLSYHKEFEISFDDFRNNFSNPRCLHNHTFENLVLYFSLEEHMKKGRIHFYPGIVFFNDRRRYKWFSYFEDFEISRLFTLSIFSEAVRKKMSFYSAFELNSSFLVKTKFKETVYSLDKLFDFKTWEFCYPGVKRSDIKKKFYNRILYPVTFLSRSELNFQVKTITEDLLSEIEILHKDWCEYKLNDPKTFKMMFSTNRYLRCLQQSFYSSLLKDSKWYRRAFYLDDKLVAVRQCLIVGQTSYDIGYFSRFWECPSNLINYINTFCMAELQGIGVKYHNTGNEMDKNLACFKKHFPHEERFGFKYNFK